MRNFNNSFNNHRFYTEKDIYVILDILSVLPTPYKRIIQNQIVHGGYGADTIPLLNIINNPTDYNMDYLHSLDSAVTEELIEIAERFELV